MSGKKFDIKCVIKLKGFELKTSIYKISVSAAIGGHGKSSETTASKIQTVVPATS